MSHKESPSPFQVTEPATTMVAPLDSSDLEQTIVVLGTGGTISCAHDERGDLVPSHSIEDIVAQAGVHNLDNVHVVARDIMALDSSDLQLADVDHILSAIHEAMLDTSYPAPLGGVIVIHGTDTMEETAMAVHCLLNRYPAPVILTGAQRPFDDPHPDGPINLRDAVSFALSIPLDRTVPPHVVFGGVALPASGLSKAHTEDDRAFVGSTTYHDAPLASSPIEPYGDMSPTPPPPPLLAPLRVEIVTAYGGCSGRVIDAIAADSQPLHGVVVAALGSGNLPSSMVTSLETLDVPVWLCTRVPFGPMASVYGGAGGGAELERLGFSIQDGLRPSQARMKLLCELATAGGQE